ncbi:alanine racemase [Spelaeicoccus albus]|uniref:D-serine deaminase-like pyridoxal phosphate-dependent protein n=1 Tax=Spelaeicoccus albus TaxID=1280376 RepID=A0A7Z0ABT9_9MICO|nr:alanine racemase [Spelaeicoccus albus]NYI67306.1 D-serine deaminase-like pyridoxal phosphate-dependent protein [Spelaeicoccus albus]
MSAQQENSYDAGRIAALGDEVLAADEKSIPVAADGVSVRDFLASGPHLSDFSTPLLTLDRQTLTDNTEHLARWCAAAGVELEPHGKTTMAPALWAEQADAGARGITLANFPQLRVGREFGFRRLQLANELTDPHAIEWVVAARTVDPEFEFACWVDSDQGVNLLQAALDRLDTDQTIDLIIDFGRTGGRSGARTPDEALAVARAVRAAPSLRLVGIGGYEGALAHHADDAGLSAVTDYLRVMRGVHEQIESEDLYAEGAERILTAGGSAFFDLVVAELGPCIKPATGSDPGTAVVLRSGAYIVHDDGFYRGISPFSRGVDNPFRSAMHAWVRVVSQPEEGLALLDAGKRDVPYDEGLPEPHAIASGLGRPATALHDTSISAVNDQHAFFRFDPATTNVRVGDVVKLGLSHPCTAMQTWRYIPVLDGSGDDPRVTDLVRTFF